MTRNKISKDQLIDTDIVEHDELISQGIAGTPYVTVSITSVVSGSITFSGFLERTQQGDILVISGSTAADGTYTVNQVTNAGEEDTIITVDEVIVDSTGGTGDLYYQSGAAITGYDNSAGVFPAGTDTVQKALNRVTTVGSPGLSFGRSGQNGPGTFLLRVGSVPSNISGYTFSLNDGSLDVVNTSNRNLETYSLTIWQHDGDFINPLLIAVVNLVSTRGETLLKGVDFTEVNAPVKGKIFAVEVTSGSVQNIGCDLELSGTKA